MLRINSTKNVRFLGDYKNVLSRILSTGECFCYRNVLYRVSNENPCANVLFVSALDFAKRFDAYVNILRHLDNPVLVITNLSTLYHFGLKFNARAFSQSLCLPVVVLKHSLKPLFEVLHISCASCRRTMAQVEDYDALFDNVFDLRRMYKKYR